jgi:exopolysaccharide biosynthesis polyprenyl glycosylphosphotransferase
MLLNRHRGLANLHALFTLLGVMALFWLYGEIIIRWFSDTIRLTREANLSPYFLSIAVGMVLGSRYVFGLGDRLLRMPGAEAAALAAQQVVLVALVVFSMMFATQDRSISRLFLGTYLVLSWVMLIFLHRTLPRRLATFFYGQAQSVSTLLVGRSAHSARVAEWLRQRSDLGLQVVGFIGLEAGAADAQTPFAWLGGLEKLPCVLAERSVGQVVLLETPADHTKARAIIEQCQAHGCRLLIHHDIEEKFEHPLVLLEESGHHFLTLHDEPLEEPINRMTKRAFDLAVSLPIVVLVLPLLCAVVWLMQRLQSPGPLFHVRPRAGEQRANFPMLKFRTMHLAPPDPRAEAKQAAADDARVYPFARFLRRHSLDEFPQFWNVLLGQMSVVGPRPVMPLLDEEFERQVRSYRTKHLVKPGITGLAQSEGFRGEITTSAQLHERVRLDLYYIAHWSLWLDLQITAKTLWQVFVPPKSAY